MKGIPKTFIIEIQLRDALIPIWRIIEVKRNIKLHDLHLVIQAAMGWKCAHLYKFVIDGTTYEYPYRDAYDSEKSEDSRKFSLYKLDVKSNDAFKYVYDFGDNWEHNIVVRGLSYQSTILSLRNGSYCSSGAMACPPEDIGGIHVYNELVEYLLHKKPILVNPDLEEWFKGFDIYDTPSVQDYFFDKTVKRFKRNYRK